jgi:hypothetical protein
MGWANGTNTTYSTDSTNSNATTWYTTSSVSPEVQKWFSVGPNGELVEMDTPGHSHVLTNHQHEHSIVADNGGWSAPIWGRATFEGEEMVRFKDNIEVKINGKWISMEETINKIEALESVLEKLLANVHMNNMTRSEIQEKLLKNRPVKKEVEHIDPDLFKI